MTRKIIAAWLWAGLLAAPACGADKELPTFTDAKAAGEDYAVQGEYLGEVQRNDDKMMVGVQVIALGGGKFRAEVFQGGLPGEGWDRGKPQHSAEGKLENGEVVFIGGEGAKGVVKDGAMTISNSSGRTLGTLPRVERTSKTEGEEPPDGATVLFDGTSADNFVEGKLAEENLLLSGCASEQEFGDHKMHLEFRTPFMPTASGQERGNSGVYLQDRYEIQVLDSFGLEGANNECGGVYGMKAPSVNMCYPPLAWQTYDVDFTAAKFDDAGKKSSNARLTLYHNGVKIYDDIELPAHTPGGAAKEAPGIGPLKLQDHGNPVVFRNIWVVEK
ncbi:MAG: DUF1080 domain-containing protein [Pirellulales bacterium]